jgi:hypothetical protein
MFLRHRPTRNLKQRPALEGLEGRQLMSIGSEFQVNTTTQGLQSQSDNASSTNGTSVVVWTNSSPGVDSDIRAKLYSASGKAGPEFIVASKAGINEYEPAVAMDAQGDFVVSWTEREINGDTNVLAQKFNAAGVRMNGIVQVGVGTFREYESDVAMDARGDFVVSYTRDTNNTNPDIFAKQYDSAAQLVGVISVAGSPKAETRSKIAMTPDGRFDIAYQLQYGLMDNDVYASRYSAAGGLLGTTAIAASIYVEDVPSVAIDDSGNAVVAYEESINGTYSIEANRLSSSGVLGAQITIRGHATGNEEFPAVALRHGGGAFVVAYADALGVEVSEVNSSNHVVTTWDSATQPYAYAPAISINGADQFLMTETSITPTSDENIVGRRGSL